MKSSYHSYIIRRDKACFLCKTLENLHVHHIIPRGAGGKSLYQNLITLCLECHSTKAHGHDQMTYRTMFLAYTKEFETPFYWPRVMDVSYDLEEKSKARQRKLTRKKYAKDLAAYKQAHAGLSPIQWHYRQAQKLHQKTQSQDS